MNKISDKLDKISAQVENQVKKAKDQKEINDIKIKQIGRKSELNQIMKNLGKLDVEERAEVGKKSNEIKGKLDSLITSKLQEIKVIELEKNIGNSKIDITIPGVRPETGSVHPITQMMQKTEEIFEKMGFEIYTPFEIDDDYHNFTSLNMPEGHPARDAWDTFWTEDEHILITHTSSMQNRILKSANPPIRANALEMKPLTPDMSILFTR